MIATFDLLTGLPRCVQRTLPSNMALPVDILPPSLPPRGLSRVQAAAYVGVSPTLFDAMVSDGSMPKPKRYHTRTIWDRANIDEAFAALPGDGKGNPWDDAA